MSSEDTAAFTPLSKERCLAVVREESESLAKAAQRGLAAKVPRYPDWSVADLVVHTGLVHDWVERIVRELAQERLDRQPPPTWNGTAGILLGWFRSGAERLAATLTAADPATAVWTFAGEHQVSFWLRRMAHETATHRWDAESAFGTAEPFAADLAASGITESLAMHLPHDDTELAGSGERIALVPTGGAAMVALLELDGGRVKSVRPGEGVDADGRTDATIRGSLTELWLLLTGRSIEARLSVEGDRAVFDRLIAAVGRVGVPARPAG